MTNSKYSWVKKVHTFRLKKEDEELYHYLESLPRMKKSESIRGMLLFALKYMVESDRVFNNASANTNSNNSQDFQELKSIIENNYEATNEVKKLLIDLQNNASLSIDSQELEEDEEVTLPDESDKKSLDSIFDVFGVDFSD